MIFLKYLFKTLIVSTVKSLINARAFIRIIVHFAEGGGRLLEAIVFCKTHSEV